MLSRKKILMLCAFISCSLLTQAQKLEGISVSVLKESLSFPFTRFAPVHPGGEVGFTILDRETEKSITNWNLVLGGYHHKRLANSLYLKGEYAYRPILKSSWTLDLIGSLGYMHTFYPGEVYELNTDNGEFEQLDQVGRGHLLASTGVGVTYIKHEKIQPFIRQEIAFETPFANGIPVIVHSFLKLGVSLKLNK